MRNPRWLAPLLPLLLAVACAVDDRELRASAPEAGPRGGSGAESRGAAGEDPAPGHESSGGSSAASESLVDGCADLDTDGVADCTTTLVENGTFGRDVGGWRALDGTELSWQPKNALDDLPSGSAALETATTTRAGAVQCVPLSGERLVIAYASAFVEGDAEPSATLEVSFFESDACRGEPVRSFQTPPNARTDAWTTIQAGSPSTPGTASASIALLVYETGGSRRAHAYFDNVMLKAQPLM